MADPSTSDLSKLPRSTVAAERATPRARADAAADDTLSRLARLVAERAERITSGEGLGSSRAWLDLLKQALDALEHHLDALQLLRDAEPPRGETPQAEGASETARAESASETPRAEPASEPPRGGERADIEGRVTSAGTLAPEPQPPVPAVDLQRDYPPFRDQITGLHSRHGFDAVASGELKRCRRHGRLFSLLLFQLRGIGVEELRRAANAVGAATRESDMLGRHVDRTLAVALPETAPTETRIVAERIIRHLEGVGAWDEDSRVGLVTHPAHGETMPHLVEAARAQLAHPPQEVLSRADREGWPG